MWNWALFCAVSTHAAAATAPDTQPSATTESSVSVPLAQTSDSPVAAVSATPSSTPTALASPALVAPTNAPTWPMLRHQKPQYDRLPGYGWTVFGVDAANVVLHIGLLAATNDTHTIEGSLPFSFVTVYLLSGPIIHGAHGRWGHAAGSLGLRVGLPLVFGLAGSWLFSGPPCTAEEKLQDACDTNTLEAVGFIFGGLAGAGTAIVLDAALLARGDRVLRKPRPTPVSFAPWLDAKRQLAGVRWGGTF